jgi:flagellar hook-associated protein FlgK
MQLQINELKEEIEKLNKQIKPFKKGEAKVLT